MCCVPVQILYLEKSCFWDTGQNALSQWDSRIFKSSISPEEGDYTASFFACWYKFMKIKSWFKIFWLGMFKNGCGQSGLWNLKLIVSEEWRDGINKFFACWFGTNLYKSKVAWKFLGWAWSKMGVASLVMGL